MRYCRAPRRLAHKAVLGGIIQGFYLEKPKTTVHVRRTVDERGTASGGFHAADSIETEDLASCSGEGQYCGGRRSEACGQPRGGSGTAAWQPTRRHVMSCLTAAERSAPCMVQNAGALRDGAPHVQSADHKSWQEK